MEGWQESVSLMLAETTTRAADREHVMSRQLCIDGCGKHNFNP